MEVLDHKWCITDDDGNILYDGYDSIEEAELALMNFISVGVLPAGGWVIAEKDGLEKKGLII